MERGPMAQNRADRGHADRFVDDPRIPPGPVLVARHEPDGNRDEADRNERDDDELGQHQSSLLGRGEGPDLAAMLAPALTGANRTGPASRLPRTTLSPRGGFAHWRVRFDAAVRAAEIETSKAEEHETDHDEDPEERVDLAGSRQK
jgi:hypothetical protein